VGVREYWIVFPGDRIIECFELINGIYTKTGVYTEVDEIPIQIFPGHFLSGKEIFES